MCGVCWHEVPGHEPDCPVFTGVPVRGYPGMSQEAPQEQIQGQLMQGGPAYSPYHAYHGQSEIDTRILAELASIRTEVARILQILTDAKPVLDVLTKIQAIGSEQEHK